MTRKNFQEGKKEAGEEGSVQHLEAGMPGRRWANPQSRGPLGWEGQAAGEGKQGLATPSGAGHRAGTTAPGSEPTSQSKAKQSKAKA